MSTNFISPVGRLVQGGMTLQPKKDGKGQPVIKDGVAVQECFMAIAIRKDDPALGAFYALFDAQARMNFPHLFRDAAGNPANCTHPQFAWKVQDGDGRDAEGQSVANKPGFAGHYIFKMASRYPPKCFHYGKYDVSQQIQNPDDVIKKGYYVRVSGTIDGNGVESGTAAKPGLYVSPNLVELVAFGEVITTGPDAATVFGTAPAITALPAGASATPILPAVGGSGVASPTGLLTPPALPGATTAMPSLPGAATAMPSLPGATTAMPSLPGAVVQPPTMPMPSMPGANMPLPNAAPTYTMTASAQGATRQQLLDIGWTDEALIRDGHMIKS
jgi:hypothetical protein